MMQACHSHGCPAWAQWRVRKPHLDADGKIVSLELIAMLCGVHKQEQEARPDNKELKFDFMGVAPAWH